MTRKLAPFRSLQSRALTRDVSADLNSRTLDLAFGSVLSIKTLVQIVVNLVLELKAEKNFLSIAKTRGANSQPLELIWFADEILFSLNIHTSPNDCSFAWLFFFQLSSLSSLKNLKIGRIHIKILISSFLGT